MAEVENGVIRRIGEAPTSEHEQRLRLILAVINGRTVAEAEDLLLGAVVTTFGNAHTPHAAEAAVSAFAGRLLKVAEHARQVSEVAMLNRETPGHA